MNEVYEEGQEIINSDFSIDGLSPGEYENCSFLNCNLAGVDLSDIRFIECSFEQCDLSNTNLGNTAFRDVRFTGCKMLGLRFDSCNEFLFEVRFSKCQLNLSSFYGRKLSGTQIDGCSLHDVDFGEADLSGTTLEDSDLSGASFEYTNLEKADLRTAYNFVIDPEVNKIDKAKFSQYGLSGLLAKYDIIIE